MRAPKPTTRRWRTSSWEEVRNLTASKQTTLHASLAGGRKTMTFYLGYAMSLFGRKTDVLSHVLVTPEFENQRDFFFPDEAHANAVTLADIPFIRHRATLPRLLQQQGETINFRELVTLFNLGDVPDDQYPDVRLTLDCSQRALRLSDAQQTIEVEIGLGPLEFAFYLLLTRATLEQETDCVRPKDGDPGFARSILETLLELAGEKKGENWSSVYNILVDSEILGLREPTLTALYDCENKRPKPMSPSWFDSRINKIATELEKRLPPTLAKWLVPQGIWDKDGEPLAPGRPSKKGGYGIPLSHISIEP